jgi:Fe-S-cluster containining protein
MECRPACAACCIAPAIIQAIPGMPNGKPAGVPCVQLDEELRCRLFGRPERPGFCRQFRPEPMTCGSSQGEALQLIAALQEATAPSLRPV